MTNTKPQIESENELTDEQFYKKFGLSKEEAQDIINEANKPIWWDYINR